MGYTTEDKLNIAKHLMKEAERILESIDNDSLEGHYGYSKEIIQQQLNMFSDNSSGYMGRNTPIDEIINSMGDDWSDQDEGDYESEANVDLQEFNL